MGIRSLSDEIGEGRSTNTKGRFWKFQFWSEEHFKADRL